MTGWNHPIVLRSKKIGAFSTTGEDGRICAMLLWGEKGQSVQFGSDNRAQKNLQSVKLSTPLDLNQSFGNFLM